MAVHERNRCVSIYHALVAVLMLVCGGILLGIGIWLEVTDNAGPANLEYAGDNVFKFVLNFGIGSIVIGGFLIVTAIAGLFALARKCVGVTFRVIYILMALVVLAALIFICVVSIVILRNDDSQEVKDFLADAWRRTADDPNTKDEVCKLEEFYECRGFNDNDCINCPLGTEDACTTLPSCANCQTLRDPGVGCYDQIIGSVSDVFLPMAITSGIVAGIVLIDIFITCAL